MSIRQRLLNWGEKLADTLGFGSKALQIFYDQRLISQNIMSSATTGLRSNVLMSPVMWVMRAFTEAQLVVQRRREDSGGGIIWDRVIDHEVEALVDKPNPAYDGDSLWKGTVLSYTMNGNAFWLKVRNVFGDVVQLWYIPHWLMKPVRPSDGSEFLSHWEYTTGKGPPVELAPRDVLHLRFGIDPENTLLGYSQLQAVLREVLTDDEAAKFSEQILQNMGVPGLVLSPKGAFKPKKDEVDALKNYLSEAWTGKRRGLPLVMSNETEVSQFGFDPNKLMLPNLRDISEERVCSAIGIPAAVVGFGSGLQSTKVGATMRELVKLAWVQCVRPMQTSLGRQVTDQLLPDFVGSNFRRAFRARFDTSEVSAFQEEAKDEAERVSLLVREGILRVDRAQHILGLEVDPTRAVYLKSETTGQPNGGTSKQQPEDADVIEDEDIKALREIATRRALASLNGNH